jgi:hypothetical protein
MGKDFRLESHILEDDIVSDGIGAINKLGVISGIPSYISGGMAVSSYLPGIPHRRTIDLDFNSLWSGRTEEFWEMARPLEEFLRGKGYKVTNKKQKSTFDVHYDDGTHGFMIQHQKRSTGAMGRYRQMIERELDNVRTISRGSMSYNALSPEDIIIRKLHRIFKFSRQHKLDFPDLRSLGDLEDHIKKEKKELLGISEPGHLDIIRLRMEHDLYDIKRLGAYTDIDMEYLRSAVPSWNEDAQKFIDTLKEVWDN